MTAAVLAALFFADPSHPLEAYAGEPAVVEMPRANAYHLSGPGGVRRLEDRFEVSDLWFSRAVAGRWVDRDGRMFSLFDLKEAPPPLADGDATRVEYSRGAVPIDVRDRAAVADAVAILSPVAPAEKPSRPRQLPRGFKEVLYFQGAASNAVVCAFLRDGATAWRLATWSLAEGDDFGESLKTFDREFLHGYPDEGRESKKGRKAPAAKGRKAPPSERDLRREDARHSVAAYSRWHFSSDGDLAVLDDLPASAAFVAALTNDMAAMRARYAAAVPSPVDASGALCVARIYADAEEYGLALEVDGRDAAWSAAHWSPSRREIVAYLPPQGEEELLRTFRHEAFHQYLSYAAAMIPASPWLNEGYAVYFENEASQDWGFEPDLEALGEMVPALLRMGYAQFYAGTDEERRLKYRLAWSLAVFLERGAPEVRFAPFRNVKADYVAALLKTKDMHAATDAAFRDEDFLASFVREWRKFWEGM